MYIYIYIYVYIYNENLPNQYLSKFNKRNKNTNTWRQIIQS